MARKKSKGTTQRPTSEDRNGSEGGRRRGAATSSASTSAPTRKAWERVAREQAKLTAKDRKMALAEGMKKTSASMKIPLPVLRGKIRHGFQKNGTNVVQNDNDPMGDGDQSLFTTCEHIWFHEDLFVTGGDVMNHFRPVNVLSDFVNAVLTGNVPLVEEMLMGADGACTATGGNQGGTPSSELVALLETRVTSMRLSPLLFIVHAGKVAKVPRPDDPRDDGQVAVAKLLLRYGARPDAKDVVGKTVFHYGAGADSTNVSLIVADMCLQAQEGGSHMFGKKVTLTGLFNEAMNGREGIALGFDVDTGRRYVSMPGGNGVGRRKVAVKPANLRLAEDETESRQFVRLCDVQDRFGAVALREVVNQEEVEVAKFLLERKARVDIPDFWGVSPLSIAMSPMAQLSREVCRLINDHVSSMARRDRRKLCSSCGMDEKVATESFSLCSGCKVMRYCSRECQLHHWKASHKLECRDIQAKKEERVVLERGPESMERDKSLAMAHALSKNPMNSKDGSYQMPRDVQVGQKFTVRAQAAGSRDTGSLLIYNQSRDCSFFMRPGQAGFAEVFDAVRAEKATDGSKTYMKALFDEEGNCVAFPGDTRIHTW